MAPEVHVLVLTLHHIASDLWSRGILLREFAVLYREACNGRNSTTLPPLPIQYADFALWQRDWLQGEVVEKELAFWRERLADPTRFEMLTDRPRPAEATWHGGRESLVFPAALAGSVRDMAQRRGLTLFMALLTGWYALLHRITGQSDLLVGTPVAYRKHRETEGLVGFFLNTLVLRATVRGRDSFADLLDQVKTVTLDAYAHDELPFEWLVEALAPERDLSTTPFFQVLFTVVRQEESGAPSLEGLKTEVMKLPDRTAKFDLNLGLGERGDRLVAELEYLSALYDPSTARRLLHQLGHLLTGLLEEPERPLAEVSLLSAAEQHQLREWNDTRRHLGPATTLPAMFAEQVARTPEAPAVHFAGETLTYRELDGRANHLAHHLAECGVGPETVVAISVERSLEMMVGIYAVHKAGGAYLPIDPEYPEDRRRFMVEDAQAPILLTQAALREDIPPTDAQILLLDHGGNGTTETAPDVEVHPDHLAYVIYTSGSTGRPKGTRIAHRGIVNRLRWMQRAYGLDATDRVMQKTPLSFDVSVWELFWPLHTGACLVVARPGGHREANYLVDLIQQEEITTLHFVPSMLQLFVEEPGLNACSSLRRVITSGEALPTDLAERFLQRSAAGLFNLYGPTEASVDVTAWACHPTPVRQPVPIGRPIENLRIHILDPGLRPLGPGIAGELHIAGVGLARDYLSRPALTADRFIPDPLERTPRAGQRLYKTGDLACWRPDGSIEFLGRIDHQVKVRGLRIELGEIEAVLVAHGQIQEVVVTVRGDRIVAYYVATDPTEADPADAPGIQELRDLVGETLPSFMVPAVFMALEAMPLSPAGKLDRKALPAPSGERPDLEIPLVEPTTAEEEVLAGIWSQVLGLDRVGTEDSFFSLGGDSIRSLEVIARAAERDLHLTLRDIFRLETIAKLARHASAEAGGDAALERPTAFSMVPEEDRERLPKGLEDAYPLAALQAGMMYHMALQPEDPPYHNVNSWHLRAVFEPGPFQRAVDRVVDRHDVLRTSFDLGSFAEPLQLVHPEAKMDVAVVDLRGLDEMTQDREVEAFVTAEKRNLFPPEEVPQMRLSVFWAADDRFWFSVVENHAIGDGWSLHSTIAEIFDLYFAFRRGENPPVLPPPTVRYRDFIALERATLADPEARSFWEKRLANFEQLDIATWPTAAPPGRRVHQVRIPIPQETAGGLYALARNMAVPMKSLALATHFKVLATLTGQRDVTSGLVANGRPEMADGIQVRGLFLNTLPLRLRLEPGSWTNLVRQAFHTEREMLPYRRYPYQTLQKERSGEKLYDTLFNYLNFYVVQHIAEGDDLELLDFKGAEGTNLLIQTVFFPAEERSALTVDLEYDGARISRAQVQKFGAIYFRVLTAMAADSEASHEGVSLLSSGERHQVLVEWNDTARQRSPEATLHGLFAATVRRTPQAEALSQGDLRLTYAELEERSNRLAHHLRDQGIGPDQPVGVALDRTPDLVVALLAVLKADGAYIPLDPAYPRERLAHVLESAQPAAVLTDSNSAGNLPEGVAQLIHLDQLDLSPFPTTAPTTTALGQNLAYIIYTSGSTGRPKGVALTHGGAVNLLRLMTSVPGLSSEDTVLAVTTIAFDIALVELFLTFTVGARAELVDRETRLDPQALGRRAEEANATFLQATPATWRLLAESGWPGGEQFRILTGGEAFPPELAERLLPRVREVWNLYGPTETTVYSTGGRVREAHSATAIGRPLANTRVRILGPDGRPVFPGASGELCLGGAGLARGYYRQPGLTAERFLPDPVGSSGDRLYRTGDLVRLRPNGVLDYLGRMDAQVKVRGFRIELAEIEAALERHPAIRQVAAAAHEGPKERQLVAYYVASGQEPTASALRSFLVESLPEYMVPSIYVALDHLPLTPNGKIDREALPSPRPQLDQGFRAPSNPVEEALAAVWREVLRLERVGIDDNFFAIGGDSILFIHVVALAARKGLHFTPAQLYAHPTLAELSQIVEQGPAAEAPAPQAPVEPGGYMPLAPTQHRFLLFHLLNPESGVFFNQEVFDYGGDLDPLALRNTWHHLFARHEMLRARFLWEGREDPAQVIEASPPFPWREEDWREIPAAGLAEHQRRIALEERRALALHRAPVLRFLLVRLADDAWRLFWSYHHILLDGWSLGILAGERQAVYEVLRRGEVPELPPAPAFSAYLRWLRRQDEEAAVTFWRRHLRGVEGPTELPVDHRAGAAAGQAGAARRRALSLPAESHQILAAFARGAGLTVANLVQAAWALLLARYSGGGDALFGVLSSGRPADIPEVDRIVGLFITPAPLRLEVPAAAPCAEWLAGTARIQAEARRYEYLPVDRIQRLSDVPGNRPLFETMVVFQNQPVGSAGDHDAATDRGWEGALGGGDRADHPLSLFVFPGTALSLRLSFDSERFEDVAMGRLLGHLRTLLEALPAHPEARLEELPWLPAGERHQVLHGWNDLPAPGPSEAPFHELLAARAQQHPEAPAAACDGEELSYGALVHKARLLAPRLLAHGGGPGTVTALLAPRGLDFLVAMLALFESGGAYLPLDPGHPPERWRKVLDQSGAGAVLADAAFLSALDGAVADGAVADGAVADGAVAGKIEVLDLGSLLAAEEVAGDTVSPLPRTSPDALAYSIFTSGSTGLPKGAMVTHRGMVNHLWAKIDELGLEAGDVVAQNASQCFDISVWQFLAALLVGGRVEILDDAIALDPVQLLAAVEGHGVTILETVPSLLRILLDEAGSTDAGSDSGPDLRRLRALIPTGEALPPDLSRRWLAAYPHIPLVNAYGPTECSDDISHHRISTPPPVTQTHTPIGRPVPGMRLYILDPRLRPMPVGFIGELCAAGIGVGRGYLRDPGRTAEVFVPNPHALRGADGGRLYRTGDLARWLEDGTLEFLGRRDHQVKLHGFRIELGEIETLLRRQPQLKEAAVNIWHDGGGTPRLVAYLVATGDKPPAEETLRAELRKSLPEPMVPSVFVFLEAMPLSANGKLDRKALPAPVDDADGAPERAMVLPRNEIESLLASLWAEVLEVDAVSVEDDFFALGGHSLRAIQVSSRVRRSLGIDIPLAQIFEAPTVAEFAILVETTRRESEGRPAPPPIRPTPRDRPLPLSFSQRRLWFLDQLEPGNPDYNLPGAIRLGPEIKTDLLAASLAEVVRRHEVLRTRFEAVGGEPHQVIDPPGPVALPLVDLQALSASRAEDEGRRLARQIGATSFHLATGPLLANLLLRLDGYQMFFFTLHHIVTDGWTMGVLLKELTAIYEAAAEGRAHGLPEMTLQYADYAVWQREWLQGEVLEAQIAYWRHQLAGLPPLLQLPTDRPRPPLQTFRGAVQAMVLPADLRQGLLRFGRREGTTPFMVLLTLTKALLLRDTGERDIAVGTYTAGRGAAEIEGLIGFFVNTLVLRTQGAPRDTLWELHGKVRETTLGAFAHQEIPFEKLLEELQVERNLSHTPLFQVMLNYQNTPTHGSQVTQGNEGVRELGRANFDLSFAARQVGDDLAINVGYNRDLFDHTTITRFNQRFRTLLGELLADPHRPLATLPTASPAERHQMVVEWATTTDAARNDAVSTATTGPDLVHRRIAAAAAARPEAPAVVLAEGIPLSYGALLHQSGVVAEHLRGLGVGPEVPVGIFLRREPNLIVALLATLEAGGAYLPLDPAYPAERLAFMIEDSGLQVVLTDTALADGLPLSHVPQSVQTLPLDALPDVTPAAGPRRDPRPESPAYLIYTSGSSGLPKGVVVPHRALATYTDTTARRFGFHAGDRVLQFASINFDTAAEEIFPTLVSGGCLVLRDDAMLASPAGFLEQAAHLKLTVLDLPTAWWAQLTEALAVDQTTLPVTLRLVIIGGEQAHAERVDTWRSRVGEAPALWNTYGPTEATIVATAGRLAVGAQREGLVSIGRAIPGARVWVVGPDLRPVSARGVAGELLLGGVGVARGYLHRPALTAERFVPDPFSAQPGERLYKSGDRVRHRDDGELLFLGRVDQQVKIRGFRIEPGEVEARLGEHPAVRDCAVVARPTEDGDLQLIAYAETEDPAPEPAALRAFLAEQLPSHLVPTLFELLPELPHLPNGKINRRALPAPTVAALEGADSYIAPEGEIEELLAEIWGEVLHREQVGALDNFFDLGGHSLLATQVLARLRDQVEIDVPLLSLFESPTIQDFALVVEEALLDHLEALEEEAFDGEDELP